MGREWLEKARAGGLFRRCRISAHSHPRFDEGSHQPGPHRSLVIHSIARRRIARVASGVARFAGRQRAKAQRCHEETFNEIDNTASAAAIEQTNRESSYSE